MRWANAGEPTETADAIDRWLMTAIGLDVYDHIPEAMLTYLRQYGYHFNKKAYELATKRMWTVDSNGKKERVTPFTREQVDEMLARYNISVDNDIMYDGAYVASMCKADYLHSSIADDQHLALFVKDTLDDPDAGEGHVFNRWYADTVRAGFPIEWSDLL